MLISALLLIYICWSKSLALNQLNDLNIQDIERNNIEIINNASG